MIEWRPYVYGARPRLRPGDPHAEGVNCRSLVQDVLEARAAFLPRDAVELPGLWDATGRFLPLAGGLASLPDLAVLLCERTHGADGRPVDRTQAAFASDDAYRLHLHTAVLVRDLTLVGPGVPVDDPLGEPPFVLHATALAGGTCVWTSARLARHYRMVAAKDVLSAGGGPA